MGCRELDITSYYRFIRPDKTSYTRSKPCTEKTAYSRFCRYVPILDNAPAAVVVGDPGIINVPYMEKGDIFRGEVAYTNHGLIRAEDVRFHAPVDNDNFTYEIMTDSVPDFIEPKQRITLPYRITCINTPGDDGSGGGPTGSGWQLVCEADYDAACGEKVSVNINTLINHLLARNEAFASVGDVINQILENADILNTYSDDTSSGGTSGGSGNSGYTGSGTSKPTPPASTITGKGIICFKETTCDEEPDECEEEECECDDDKCTEDTCEPETKCYIKTGSSVYKHSGKFRDDITTKSYRVAGKFVSLSRVYDGEKWHPLFDNYLTITRTAGYISNIKRKGISYTQPGNAPSKPVLQYIYENGQLVDEIWTQEDPNAPMEFFSPKGYSSITITENGFDYVSMAGKIRTYDPSGMILSAGSLKKGVKYSIVRNAAGEPVEMKDGTGRTLFTISTIGDTQTITDIDGGTLQLVHNAEGLITEARKSVDADTTYVTQYQYDAKKRIIKKTAPNGRVSNITYDVNERVASAKDDDGVGYEFEYNYDPATQLIYCLTKSPEGSVDEVWMENTGRLRRYDLNGRTMLRKIQMDRKTIEINEKGEATETIYDEFENPVKITYPDETFELNEYAPQFRNLLSHTNRNGVVTKHTYNANGMRTSRIEAFGTAVAKTTEYSYGNTLFPALVTKIREVGDANTATAETLFAYDELGRVVTKTDALGNSTVTQYNNDGSVKQRTNKLGKTTHFEYDLLKRRVKTTDPLGNISRMEYDPAGNVTAVIDPLTRKTEMTYDDDGNRLTIKLNNIVNTTVYNKDGKPVSVKDAEGNETKYEYDIEGRLLKQTNPENYVTSYLYDDEKLTNVPSDRPYIINYPTRSRRFYCDLNGRVTKTVDSFEGGDSASTEYTYDNAGNLISKIDSRGLVTNNTYDSLNRLVSTTLTSDLGSLTSSSTNDLRGNTLSTTDPLGQITTYEYDKLDRLVKTTDPFGKISSTTYNELGQTIESIGPYGRKAVMTYDDAGRLSSRSIYENKNDANPARTLTYLYDANGNPISLTDSTGVVTNRIYDVLNRIISSTLTSDLGSLTSAYTYNPTGTVKTSTDEHGAVTSYLYDKLGRRTKQTLNDGTVASWQYGSNGVTLAQDRSGRRTEYAYNGFGRVILKKDPKGNAFQYAYSPAGDLLQLTDSKLNITKWDYDKLGKVTSKTYADGASTVYLYNANGQLQTRTDAKGAVTTYSYNPHGQITGVDYPNDADISYIYNPDGTLASVTDASGTTSFTYDTAGRLITENGPFENDTITHSYDDLDRRTALQFNGSTVNYNYDSLQRISNVGQASSLFSYSYRGTSRQVAQLKRNTNTVVANIYDTLGRLTKKTSFANSATLREDSFSYNNSDEIIQKTELSGRYISYAYNNASQIIAAQRFEADDTPDASYSYNFSFDPAGNRTSADSLVEGAGNPVSYNSNNLNQYTEIFNPDGSAATPQYDANGNMLTLSTSSTLEWNDENRLISVSPVLSVSGSLKTEFLYDYMGRRRVKKVFTHDGTDWQQTREMRFVYNGFKQIAEFDATDAVQKSYIWNGETLLSDTHGGATYYPQYDNNKNIVSYTDEYGNIVAEYTYSPFGKIVEKSGSMADDFTFRFSSEVFDSETGLVYYNYRYMSPELGRWLSRDPINQMGSPAWWANNEERIKLRKLLTILDLLTSKLYRDATKFPLLLPEITIMINTLRELSLYIQYELQMDLLGKRNNDNNDNPYNHTNNNPVNNTDKNGGFVIITTGVVLGAIAFGVLVGGTAAVVIDTVYAEEIAAEAAKQALKKGGFDSAGDFVDIMRIANEKDKKKRERECAKKCSAWRWLGPLNPSNLTGDGILGDQGLGSGSGSDENE